MKKAAQSLVVCVIGIWAAFFVPQALAATVYSQPNNSVSTIYWTNGAGYSFVDSTGTATSAFNLGQIFPTGITIANGAHVRFWLYSADDGTNFGDTSIFLYKNTIGGSVICGGTTGTQVTQHNQWVLYDFACPVVGSATPTDSILVVFSAAGNVAHQTYVALQGQGGGNSWLTFQPYFELSDGSGTFSNAAPAATSSQSVNSLISPNIQAIGVATTTAGQLCTTVNATSSGILDTVTNGFGTAMCYAGVILFVPPQATLNSFQTLASSTQQKFPFSYVSNVVTVWRSLQASSTANAPVYTYNLHDLGIGSTTPLGNILPNVTVLSSSTVEQYLTPSLLAVLKGLAGTAIILALVADIFFTSRNLLH